MSNAVVRRFASPRATARSTRSLLARRRYRLTFYVTTAVYLVFYLVALRDISLGGSWGVTVTDLSRVLGRRSFASFEAVAAVGTPYFTVLVSPMNLVIGAGIAALVGANIAFSYYAWRNPRACGTRNTTGFLSSLPALLAGTACCAPVILLVLGVQASAALLAFFRFALPLSVLLLLVSLAYVVRKSDIEASEMGQETA